MKTLRANDQAKYMILGAAGMLGQYYARYLKRRGITPIEILRKGNYYYSVDLERDSSKIIELINTHRPHVVINCAAIVSLSQCEKNPAQAHLINAECVKYMVDACAKIGAIFLQISTDHYYNSTSRLLHSESHPLTLLNEYSKSKRSGEKFALSYSKSIIVRTNITGFRGDDKRLTFIEWLTNSLKTKSPFNMYVDYYTSTIDCASFCYLCNKILDHNANGIFNLASSDCISKYEFGLLYAKAMNIDTSSIIPASAIGLKPRRARYVGLDCSKLEKLLQTKMPSSDQVVKNLAKEAKSIFQE